MADRHRSVPFRLLDSRGQRLDAASSRDGTSTRTLSERDGRFWAVVSNPMAVSKFFHSVLSGWMTGAVVVIGICCWYASPRTRAAFLPCEHKGSRSRGHCGGCRRDVLRGQVGRPRRRPPADETRRGQKALQRGGTRAPFSIVPGIEIPGMLSVLATGNADGYVPGIQDILDGYIDRNGTKHPSAAEMMARGDTALSAFRTYRKRQGKRP